MLLHVWACTREMRKYKRGKREYNLLKRGWRQRSENWRGVYLLCKLEGPVSIIKIWGVCIYYKNLRGVYLYFKIRYHQSNIFLIVNVTILWWKAVSSKLFYDQLLRPANRWKRSWKCDQVFFVFILYVHTRPLANTNGTLFQKPSFESYTQRTRIIFCLLTTLRHQVIEQVLLLLFYASVAWNKNSRRKSKQNIKRLGAACVYWSLTRSTRIVICSNEKVL